MVWFLTLFCHVKERKESRLITIRNAGQVASAP